MNELTIFMIGVGFGVVVVLLCLSWIVGAFTQTISSLGTAAIAAEKGKQNKEEDE